MFTLPKSSIVIAEHEGVREVAVVGFTKLPEGEEIAAFVVGSVILPRPPLLLIVARCLTTDKRPRKFVFVTGFAAQCQRQDLSLTTSHSTRSGNVFSLV